MKHLFRGFLAVALLLCCSFQMASAQQMPPIPTDPNVRIGKLSNGLTYYIRKNALPEKRADFYIAQKVGSIQEEPNQRGLAHFLEHMCFNGTKHYPNEALRAYLERIGVKFGENLNAYTSIDETVYNISNVPTNISGSVDSCLLILHDWSNDLTLDPKEIDKERGVINEEWRTRMSAGQRLQEKLIPFMYAGTKYADCFPIGTMDVVMHFKYQTLRDYYEKWYRPDLQGIVVVGDIDVDQVEAKIKQMFADIPAQPNAAKREYYQVGDNQEPIVAVEKDKEMTEIEALLFFKHEATPREEKTSMGYMVEQYATEMISSMLNNRLAELTQQANPPFVGAFATDGDFFVCKTKGAFAGYVSCKEGEVTKSIAAMLREIERARKFGFTESEYTRARAEYLRNLESQYNERDKAKNESYVREYVRNFLDNEPIPGIEKEYAIMNQIAPNIPLELINKAMQEIVQDNNRVYAVFGPDKAGLVLPTKEDVLKTANEVKNENLTAYVDKVSSEPLMAKKPVGGKIVAEKQLPEMGATEITLNNGIKVIMKKTDFKADQILMSAFSWGGSSLFPNSEMVNINNLDAVGVGGIGNFSTTDLQKVLAGKIANVSFGIGDKTQTVNGNCSPKDLETMLQLTYLTFTSPRKDDAAFSSYKTRLTSSLQNQELDPNTAFSDTVQHAFYGNHPRAISMKANMVDKINYDKLISMYKDRYKNAGAFTFIFVGNIDPAKDKQMIADYLGSLPATKAKENYKDTKMIITPGTHKHEFIRQAETPKTTVLALYSGKIPYNQKNVILASMTEQVLTMVYTEKVREEQGGTYGVNVFGGLNYLPKDRQTGSIYIYFDTAPEKKDNLMKIIYSEAESLAKNGPSADYLQKVKEFMLKKHKENVKENGFWMGNIMGMLQNGGIDMSKDYEQVVNSITAKDVQMFFKSLIDQKNRIEVAMVSPKK